MERRFDGWRCFAVEPVIFAYMFGEAISENVMTDFIVYQTCKNTPSMNDSNCNILHENSSSEEAMKVGKSVQPHAGPIIALKSFVEFLFPAFLVLFLGPWSDKNGRKLLIVFPIAGEMLHYLAFALMSSSNLNSYWLLIPSIPLSLLGGYSLLSLAVYCWVTDVIYKDYRAWHLARLETALLTGRLLGLFSSPVIFKKWGYVSTFSTSAAIYFLALTYSLIFVKESIIANGEWTIKSLFDFSLVKDLIDSILKTRDGFDKFIVCSCIGYLAMYHTILHGIMSLSYLITSSHLGWNLSDYCMYSGVCLITYIGGLLLLVKFFASIFELSDVAILVTSCLSNGASSLMKAFATKSWQMYLTSFVGMFSPSSGPVIKSIISKTVPQEDVGKVFSLTAVIELLVPIATEPLYIFVYMHTINVYPCTVWFLSTVLSLAMMLLAIAIEAKRTKFRNTEFTTLK